MKKNKKKANDKQAALNLVAKYAHKFNKSIVFKDKRKYYRKAKHKASEPFPIKCKYILLEKAHNQINNYIQHCTRFKYE